jgi:Mlc titration factor MtfA (ptsG expression regulator)
MVIYRNGDAKNKGEIEGYFRTMPLKFREYGCEVAAHLKLPLRLQAMALHQCAMTTQTLTFIALCSATLLFVLGLLGLPWWVARKRAQVRAHPFPTAWRKILQRRVPLVRRLPVDLQLQLKKHMQVFIAEKPFMGCAGLQVTDEMRVVIAAQACLLVLNRPTDFFPNLRQILVYPAAFVVDRATTDGAGVRQERRHALAGESWSEGQVILSWQDSLEGAQVADDGRNVVIHEFAHQLDQENGAANGAPLLAAGAMPHNSRRWSEVFHEAYAQLQAQARSGRTCLFSHYGAQDPAEFFAVASEVFFEQGGALAQDYPALYRELSAYYRVDPAGW